MTFLDKRLETYDYEGDDGLVYKREHYLGSSPEWWERRIGDNSTPWSEVTDIEKMIDLEEAHCEYIENSGVLENSDE